MNALLTEKYWRDNIDHLKSTLDILNIEHLTSHIAEGNYNNLSADKEIYFKAPSGQEHYRLLAFISLNIDNIDIHDIGTLHGLSALALSINKTNNIHSVDASDRLTLINSPDNIDYSYKGTAGEYIDSLLESKVIFVDTWHEGIFERDLLDKLRHNSYKGIVVFDDIWVNVNMTNMWKEIQEPKLDITKIGHATGTGIVFFE